MPPQTCAKPPSTSPTEMPDYSVEAVRGLGEITPDTDLDELIGQIDLNPGDIVLITSKVVSKAEGMIRSGDRIEAIAGEAIRTVAKRANTHITENRLGMTMAASGVDASNVAHGKVLLLPRDPDATARRLRNHAAVNLGVIITDTAGRPWRQGQTDMAIGVAGINPLMSFSGEIDSYGNPLAVTAPAIADELASAAELATGKLGQAPIAIVRGLGEHVLPPGDDGPGAQALIRPREDDLFALGTREAVMAVLTQTQLDCFGSPATTEEVAAALVAVGLSSQPSEAGLRVEATDPQSQTVLGLLALAHSWQLAGLPSHGDDPAYLLTPSQR